MTPVIANSNNVTFQSTRPSAPPSSFRMPHVFVIPPEEEQQDNPPWCCFDADGQPENFDDIPDIHFLDDPYPFQPSENIVPILLSRRTSVHQHRLRATLSKKLEKKQRPEAVKIIENKSSHSRQRDPREDSDVVEVIKVKRTRETSMDLEDNKTTKRSKTLKARATKALQSIKNVGKTSHRTHVKELWTSSETMPGIFKGIQEIRSQPGQTEDRPPILPKKGSLSRGRSLSQIFQPMKPSRVESAFTIGVPSVAPAETHHALQAANSSSYLHLKYNNTNPSLNEVPSTLTTDDALNRPIPSIPSTKRNNTLTRFSVRELHRLFSLSSSSPDDASLLRAATAGPSSPTPISSTSLSILSHDCLDVPMEDDIFTDAHFVDFESPDRRATSRYHQGFHTSHHNDLSTPRRLSNFSFEMKLDSLHFDSLSFDPDDFDVSREGNVPR